MAIILTERPERPARLRGHESILPVGAYRGRIRGHGDTLFLIVTQRDGQRMIVFLSPGTMTIEVLQTVPDGYDHVDVVPVEITEIVYEVRRG